MKGTITKYRKKDGRISWGYYFRGKTTGEQVTKSGFDTRSAAVDALNAQRDAVFGVSLPAAPEVAGAADPALKGDTRTVSEYLNYWLEEHAALRCAPKTMEEYQGQAKYLIEHLGVVRLSDLKAAAIQEMVNRLQLHGGMKTEKHPEGRPLSPKRTHAIASMLHTCLADAVRLEHLRMNPMADRRVKLPKRPKRRPAVIDPAMLGKLWEAARGLRIYPFIVTAASTGARRGEVCALEWPDIDFSTGVLTISKSLEQTKAGGLRVKGTKSGEPRYFGLDDFALEVLCEHREQQAQDKRNFGGDYHDHNLVFSQPNGDYYSPRQMGARTKEALVKAGLPEFSLHSLRHSHASGLLSAGVPLPVVSERLGHANQNITLAVYSHALPSDMRAAAKAWHNALAEAISEERKSKNSKMLEIARKKAVND
jgi:integrase